MLNSVEDNINIGVQKPTTKWINCLQKGYFIMQMSIISDISFKREEKIQIKNRKFKLKPESSLT